MKIFTTEGIRHICSKAIENESMSMLDLMERAAESATYASFRVAPTAYLPHDWQIGLQLVCYTSKSPRRESTGVPLYGCLSVNKQLGRSWNLGIDWHDMFDAFCSDTKVNRHAANVKLQYRF